MLLAVCSACAAPIKELFPARGGEPTKTIYLVNHGWHAGLVLLHSDIPSHHWLGTLPFRRAVYLEVGWGDKDYYQTPDPHLGIKLKALFLPTTSVLHIVGINAPVTGYFANSEIIQIELTVAGFERLLGYIAHSHAMDDAGQAIPLEAGLYGDSRFYLSRERYTLFKTCNTWTARALRAAGYPITPAFTFSVNGLMRQALIHGRLIQAAPNP